LKPVLEQERQRKGREEQTDSDKEKGEYRVKDKTSEIVRNKYIPNSYLFSKLSSSRIYLISIIYNFPVSSV
jgi:hypothetical protein